MNKKEIFIKKSIKIHKDKYDYSSVEYVDNKTKIKILCKTCNDYFEQKPHHHNISKCGCPKCAKNKKLSSKDFIDRAQKKHSNKYDYSLVEYKNMHTKVKIICKKHGIIEQLPMSHLKCKPCCCEKSNKSNTTDFIFKAKKIHKDKYDYSLTKYINSSKKVKIICNYHDSIFEQTPSNHLSKKHGCPLCGNINRRLSRIKEISKNKFDGNQIIPSFSSLACSIFDTISKEQNIHIQHGMNGGELHIEKLGYWIDGYDKINNTVYEYDEKHHFDKNGELSSIDLIRQKEIEKLLKCTFIRIKYSDF